MTVKHQFSLINVDTDSIMVCHPEGRPFTIEEQKILINELNAQFPEHIQWDEDGYFHKVIVIKAKNYILFDGEKRKIKGSSIRDSKKEPALKEMMERMIQTILDNDDQFEEKLNIIYLEYIKEVLNIKDIHRWCQKKTITKAILACENHEKMDQITKKEKKIRKNESNIWDATKNIEGLQEGDKIYVYPAILETKSIEKINKKGQKNVKNEEILGLKLDLNWINDHHINRLLKRVIDTVYIFESIINMDKFINFSLKKNQLLLKDL